MNSSPREKAGRECFNVSMLGKAVKISSPVRSGSQRESEWLPAVAWLFGSGGAGGKREEKRERRRRRDNEREKGGRRRRSCRGGCKEWFGWLSVKSFLN